MGKLGGDAMLKTLDEACGSKGTYKAAFQKVVDAMDAVIKGLTPECKPAAMCAKF
jgi:hypothetical protein